MEKLQVAPRQRIARMSCGQRSQVALGLILAQNAELLILDDFSMGLDPGYRRLFVEYLRDYARSREKSVFLTSHIIQDMEKLIDDCIIMDYGRILIQMPVRDLLGRFRRYTFTTGRRGNHPRKQGDIQPRCHQRPGRTLLVRLAGERPRVARPHGNPPRRAAR